MRNLIETKRYSFTFTKKTNVNHFSATRNKTETRLKRVTEMRKTYILTPLTFSYQTRVQIQFKRLTLRGTYDKLYRRLNFASFTFEEVTQAYGDVICRLGTSVLKSKMCFSLASGSLYFNGTSSLSMVISLSVTESTVSSASMCCFLPFTVRFLAQRKPRRNLSSIF